MDFKLRAPGTRQPTGHEGFLRAIAGSGGPGINNDLRALQAQGRLTPEVLTQLKVLATHPLAEGIDRKALLYAALREIVDPERIAQGFSHTCTAAVVQAKLAQDNPSEYLRLLSGLASRRGEVTFANGEMLRRHADWQVKAGRPVTGDLMQPAFMQFAAGSYEPRTDTHSTANGLGQGLYAQEQTDLLNAVSGKQNTTVFGNGPKVLAAMEKTLAKGQTVPVVLAMRDRDTGGLQGHSVLVKRIKDGQVTFLDPGGKRRTVSLGAFTERLRSASLPKAVVTASLIKTAESQTGVLAGSPGWGGMVSAAVKSVAQAVEDQVLQLVRPAAPVLVHERRLRNHGRHR